MTVRELDQQYKGGLQKKRRREQQQSKQQSFQRRTRNATQSRFTTDRESETITTALSIFALSLF